MRYLAFLLLFFSSRLLQSQTTDPELDKKYTPNENSPFNMTQINRDGGGSEKEVSFGNSLKYTPTMLIRQKLYFSYERRLFKPVTIILGVGKAFGGDFIQGTYLGSLGLLGGAGNNVIDLSTLYNNSDYYDSSVLLSGGLRVYFSGTAFDGGFFEFFYRRETFEYHVQSKVGDYPLIGDNRLFYRMNGYSLGYGYQFIGGKKNKLVHEIAFNLGFKVVNYTEFDKITGSGSTPYKVIRTDKELSVNLYPAINFSYSFGFGF